MPNLPISSFPDGAPIIDTDVLPLVRGSAPPNYKVSALDLSEYINTTIGGAYVLKSGDTMTGTLTVNTSTPTDYSFISHSDVDDVTDNISILQFGSTGYTITWDAGSQALYFDSNIITPDIYADTGTIETLGSSTITGAFTNLSLQARPTNNRTINFGAWNNTTGVPTFTNFITATSKTATATCDISDAVTKAGGYIYRAGGTDVPLGDGGTNASLTAVNGGVVYSTASAMAITAAGTAGQLFRSSGAGQPVWTTAIYPDTANLGNLLYGGAVTNTIDTLPGNTTTTKKYLSQTGTGVVSAVPVWDDIDLSTDTIGILPVTQGGLNNDTFTDGTLIFYNDDDDVFQDVALSFYDTSTGFLGIGSIGTVTPETPLHVVAGSGENITPLTVDQRTSEYPTISFIGYIGSDSTSTITDYRCDFESGSESVRAPAASRWNLPYMIKVKVTDPSSGTPIGGYIPFYQTS